MALQPRIIACGNSIAAFSMAVRFLTGPAVMAVASIAVGLRGVLLRVAIVQVTLFSLSSDIASYLAFSTSLHSKNFFPFKKKTTYIFIFSFGLFIQMGIEKN